MKLFFLVVACCLSFGARAQALASSTIEKAKQAVRADIEARVATRKILYQPGEFQISPYTNPDNNAALAGGTLVEHQFLTRDSMDFVKSYHVLYVVTTSGEVYVREVINPRR